MGNTLQKEFPFRLFYKIGEASKIVGVEPYVLRYWESEFPFLKPQKTKSGQRLYTKKDIELILLIKKMLYQEKFTIEGVRQKLGKSNLLSEGEFVNKEDILNKIRIKLREILEILS